MCGIYGITENNELFINNLINISTHRGPDGRSIFINDQVTLGHNLLSITENPNKSIQPWVSKNGNVLIYNGEIFNYHELIHEFHNKFIPETNCDTELLSWLLDNFSVDDVVSKYIDSMHAFAYYNVKKNLLFLSRDHAGIKPLYYIDTSSKLIFASEIKGLMDLEYVNKKIHLPSFVCMAQLGINFFRNTLFENLKKVMPGETMVYDITNKKFIRTNRFFIKPQSKFKFDPGELRNEVKQTVKLSTIGIKKFGIFLSGGLDSSIIAYEFSSLLEDFKTYTNYMEPNIKNHIEDFNDDYEIAKQFTYEKKIDHQGIKITPEIIMQNWLPTIKYMEEPRYNMNLPMYFYTNQFIKRDDVTITISGDMGDELLGGYPKYLEFSKLSQQPSSKKDLIKIWMNKFKNPITLNLKFDNQDLLEELNKQIPDDIWNPDDPLNSYMALDCITHVPEDFFNRNDKFGMAASMEGRFPFATKRFMNYCLNIHSKFKLGNNINELKLPFRLSYKNYLPDYLINKSKTGWSVPIMFWLILDKKLQKEYIKTINRDDCLANILKKENYLKPKPRIISWMVRSWAQEFNLNLN